SRADRRQLAAHRRLPVEPPDGERPGPRPAGGAAMSAPHAIMAAGCLIVASVVAVVAAIRDAVAKIEAVGGVIADTARAHGSLLADEAALAAAEGEHSDRLLAELWAHNEHLDRLLASLRAPIDPRDAEMWARRVLDRDSDEWIIREVSK